MECVDFSDVTDDDIKAVWELLCKYDRLKFRDFVTRYPAWSDFPFKRTFETVEAYKQYLYKSILRYETGVARGFAGAHVLMQELHDTLKNPTLAFLEDA